MQFFGLICKQIRKFQWKYRSIQRNQRRESDTREQRFWKRSVQRYDERSIVRNAIRRTVTRYVTGCSTRSRVKINADLCPNPLHRGNVNILVAIVYIYTFLSTDHL